MYYAQKEIRGTRRRIRLRNHVSKHCKRSDAGRRMVPFRHRQFRPNRQMEPSIWHIPKMKRGREKISSVFATYKYNIVCLYSRIKTVERQYCYDRKRFCFYFTLLFVTQRGLGTLTLVRHTVRTQNIGSRHDWIAHQATNNSS